MTASAIRMSFALGLMLLAGCAHVLQFRVTDASSGSVISGVKVKIREGSSFSYFYREPHEREVGSTDTNGIITLRAINNKDTVFFRAPGYRGAVAGFVGLGKVGIVPNPPRNVDTMYREQKVVKSSQIIDIPLEALSKEE